jgi:hypothetical protein
VERLLCSVYHAWDTKRSKFAILFGDIDTLEWFGLICLPTQLIYCFHAAGICIPDNTIYSRRFTAIVRCQERH